MHISSFLAHLFIIATCTEWSPWAKQDTVCWNEFFQFLLFSSSVLKVWSRAHHTVRERWITSQKDPWQGRYQGRVLRKDILKSPISRIHKLKQVKKLRVSLAKLVSIWEIEKYLGREKWQGQHQSHFLTYCWKYSVKILFLTTIFVNHQGWPQFRHSTFHLYLFGYFATISKAAPAFPKQLKWNPICWETQWNLISLLYKECQTNLFYCLSKKEFLTHC